MADLLRCADLISHFRMRLGHPREGTFGRVYYDGINKDLDEMLTILNEAQRHVTWICYSANHALLEDTFYIDVLDKVTRYTLPERTLGPVAVFHRAHGQEYEVERANLFEIRAQTRSQYSDYVFRYYEIREQVPIMSAPRGVVAADHATNLVSDDFGAVRVGDTVHNLTDGSQGTINAVHLAFNRISVEQLEGGKTNTFRRGDVYQIDMTEKTRDAIDFFPEVSVDNSVTAYSGRPTNIVLQEDHILIRIDVTIPSLPSNFEEDERLHLRMRDADNKTVAASGITGITAGTHEFRLTELSQIREDTTYNVTLTRAITNTDITISRVTLIARNVQPAVEVRRACLPRPMETRDDYCEMPAWSLPAVYAYAHILAQKKLSRNPNADAGLLAEFRMEIENIKAYKFKVDERNVGSLMGMNRRRSWNYPGNYGHAGPSPFDLL